MNETTIVSLLWFTIMTISHSMKPKKVTMKMIAEEAGVSIQTVSRVVNKHPDVAQATYDRIQEVMQRLHYMPNVIARNLSQQRTEMIGVVVESLKTTGPIRTLAGVIYGADQQGYCILMEALKSFSKDDIIRSLNNLRSRQVDGILWSISEIGDFETWLYDYCEKYIDVPMVFLMADETDADNVIYLVNYKGAYVAVKHLIDQGYQHIAHISGPYEWKVAHRRKKAWEDALRDAGRVVSPNAIVQGDWSPNCGHTGLMKLMQQYPQMDAVFAANDQTALGVLQMANQLGIRVPEDLGVVGYDDMRLARDYRPALTTVRQDFREFGSRGVAKLVNMIQGGEENISSAIQPEFIVRESSLRNLQQGNGDKD